MPVEVTFEIDENSLDGVKQHGRRIDSSELLLVLTCCLT